MESTTVVLMEADAVWPCWLDAYSNDAETLWQAQDDSGMQLFDDALERIRSSATFLKAVVVVCSPAASPARAAARETLLRGLVSALDFHANDAEVVLVSDGDYGTREELATLVWQISGDLELAQSDTRIRFRAQPRSTRPPAPLPGE